MGNSNINPIPFLGGIIVIVCAIVSLFVEQLSWGVWTQLYDPILGNNTTKIMWYNAFFGGKLDYDEATLTNFGKSFTAMGVGVIVILGGVLCLISKKNTAILGGSLILAGCILYVLLFGDMVNAVIDQLNIIFDLTNISVSEIFSGSRTYTFLGSYTFSWKMGYGFYGGCIGGLLGLVGGFLARSD